MTERRDTYDTAGARDLWVFAYASLVWRPEFHAAETRPARVHGFHRCLQMWSRVNRGTPEEPGLVFALLPGGFGETLGNPGLDVLDIPTVSAIAHESGLPLLVDSTFTTPWLMKPFDHGADLVFHSATKFLSGHGTVIGGVLVDSGRFDWDASGRFPELTQPYDGFHGMVFSEESTVGAFLLRARREGLRDFGACMSPHTAWLMLQGIETLPLRMARHVENARKVATFLASQPGVARVLEQKYGFDLAYDWFASRAVVGGSRLRLLARAHIDHRARRNVVDDDRDSDRIVHRLEVLIHAFLNWFVVIRNNHQHARRPCPFGMQGQINRFGGRIGSGARDHRYAPRCRLDA